MLIKCLTLSTSNFIIYPLGPTSSLTPVSIYGLRGDLMDYKTFSCEEPSCVPVECPLL